jgi:hypothetical protein
MAQVLLTKYRFKPGGKEAWFDWCRELTRRRDEVLETLRNEGISVEACFLSPDEDGVYYVIEVEDFAKALAAYSASPYPIDAEHAQRKGSALEEVGDLRCLFYFKSV